jgi:hypothetical protein
VAINFSDRDSSNMTCEKLARRLSELQPELCPVDVARIALMILTQCEDTTDLADDQALMAAWKHATFRLEAASDQHAAVAEELDAMCSNGPVRFTPDQLWVLLRAVKVQSQILELYTDQPALA